MEKLDLYSFVGKPLDIAKQELEKLGYKVDVLKNSKPKIKTDRELVVSLKQTANSVILIVGDFLINVEGGNELV